MIADFITAFPLIRFIGIYPDGDTMMVFLPTGNHLVPVAELERVILDPWQLCQRGGNDATLAAAWYSWNSESSTHPVGQMPDNGNALGLYDMSGNVWEWCFSISDTDNTHRVFRGGGWDNPYSSLQIGILNHNT